MRFTPQFLDELKARLPVSEVVGKRVALKKAGREWKGLSPFNKEKTASFFVNDQKAAWFDFSSGKNGNIFDRVPYVLAPAVKAIVAQQVDPRIAADLKAFDFKKVVDNSTVERLVKDGYFEKLFGDEIKAEEQRKAKIAFK